MTQPAGPFHTPCPSCHGQRFYVLPNWHLGPGNRGGLTKASICVDPGTSGMIVQYAQIPLTLRVCAHCGAAQTFADPAAVQALVQGPRPSAYYLDASQPPPGAPR